MLRTPHIDYTSASNNLVAFNILYSHRWILLIIVFSTWSSCDISRTHNDSSRPITQIITIIRTLSMLYQPFQTLSSCNGTSGCRYVKSVCLQKLHDNGITSIVVSNRQIGMEGIGRLRKVKSKVVEEVEKIVEKSKEKLESKKEIEPFEDQNGSTE
jgi:hypothetical protein